MCVCVCRAAYITYQLHTTLVLAAKVMRCIQCSLVVVVVVVVVVVMVMVIVAVADPRWPIWPCLPPQSGHGILCGQLIFRNISKIGATRCQILRLYDITMMHLSYRCICVSGV